LCTDIKEASRQINHCTSVQRFIFSTCCTGDAGHVDDVKKNNRCARISGVVATIVGEIENKGVEVVLGGTNESRNSGHCSEKKFDHDAWITSCPTIEVVVRCVDGTGEERVFCGLSCRVGNVGHIS
jgi:hypothetical protein